jgi:hypothetical protein
MEGKKNKSCQFLIKTPRLDGNKDNFFDVRDGYKHGQVS